MSQGYGPQDGQPWGQQDPNQQPPWGQQPQQDQWSQQPQQSPSGQDQGQPQWGQQPQQGQWGQQPQQPEQPQWGQPSPAPATDPWGQPSAQPAFGSPSDPGYSGGSQPLGSPHPGGTPYPGAPGGAPQYTMGDGANWSRVRMLGMSLLIGVALLLLIRLGISVAQFAMADSLASGTQDPGALALGTSLVSILLMIANTIVTLAVLVLAIMAAVMGRGRARVGGIVVAVLIPVAIIASFLVGGITGGILGAIGEIDTMTGIFSTGGYQILAVADAIRVLVLVGIMAAGAYFVVDTAKKKLSA